jgi:ribosomal-protein-alanine N-acetyltransferase
MMHFISRLLWRGEPALSAARPADAAAIAAVHGVSFQRGWDEHEIHQLLIENNVVAHRAMAGGKLAGRKLTGFILSRLAAGEAEILSVAVAPAWRGRKLSRPLLDLHLRRLAGLGVHSVFLEVGENNAPACRLYRRAGFREVGRRQNYYQQGYYEGGATALVLRRDLG